jgi:hypothetical protein
LVISVRFQSTDIKVFFLYRISHVSGSITREISVIYARPSKSRRSMTRLSASDVDGVEVGVVLAMLDEEELELPAGIMVMESAFGAALRSRRGDEG